MGPLLILGALVLIPLALTLAFGLAVLAAGLIAVRALIKPARNQELGGNPSPSPRPRSIGNASQILDVEYEVKETNEKG